MDMMAQSFKAKFKKREPVGKKFHSAARMKKA
jgi:hypothetical protein